MTRGEPGPVGPRDELAETIRIEGARILATLVRTTGSLSVAEDAVQEASLAALETWPRTGVPAQPRAWLTVAARHRAIDILRREAAREGKERVAVEMQDLMSPDEPTEAVVRDDQLRLIFTCCHPALAPEARVALALRVLCGLSPARIASVLLTTEPAIAKRLTRTRSKIAAARIPYRVPSAEELPARLATVCGVIHGLYTAGHSPLDGEAAVDTGATAEALRLARSVHELLPDEPMPAAVLALLLLTEARSSARVGDDGDPVPLPEQDRSRWDAAAIEEGLELLADSLRRSRRIADPYQLQAAIAAEHARAPRWRDTDWPEVARLYALLLSVAPNHAAAMGRAVAVAEVSGPESGLAALDGLPTTPLWHALRGELLARAGRTDEAIDALTRSLDGPLSAPERRSRERRVAALREMAGASG
jgi:RNA polymerase sigma-70 factor (ECF subfamily)